MKKIYKNVIIGKNANIGEYVMIGEPPWGYKDGELTTIIGENCVIRSYTVIYAGNKIGNNF
jgi:acyl-[acyl carrier protein]--UDP-N-acetylglucosamine O-acyltransferase